MKLTRPRRYKDKRVKQSLFSIKNFCTYLVLVSFIVTCCLMLFLMNSGLNATWLTTYKGAFLTGGNVILLSIMLSVIDNIRKRVTIAKPVNRILEATKKITEGNFNARIKPIHKKPKTEMDFIIEDFNVMAQELSGTEALRGDFISSVSHELKTPLAAIQNYAALLQSDDITEAQHNEYVKRILASSQKLSSLITNILKLNKLENQQIFPKAEVFNLSEQVREALLSCESLWEERNIEMHIDIADDVMIKGDEELIYLVWRNLLSNAFKFTLKDIGKISVTVKKEDGNAVVTVTDNGVGMDEETVSHIFEKFYQGDTSHSIQGNGLGLPLVKRVLDISNGTIDVESVQGKGSVFTVTFRAE